MGNGMGPNFRARQLGRLLRRLREDARLTQEEAGKPVLFSPAKMCRIENGQLPDYNGLKALLDVYGLTVNEWEPVIDLWHRARDKGWWHGYGLEDCRYVSMEHEASQVRTYQASYFPGLLQTESYARAVFDASGMSRSRKTIKNQVEVRMRRQERLFEDDPLVLDAVIDESVLVRGLPPKVVREQLRQVVRRAELPNVTVRVVPSSTGLHEGLEGSFSLLGFPDGEEQEVVYAEHAIGSVHIDHPDTVAAVSLRFKRLSELALDQEASVELIKRIATEAPG